jgi:hypothetical protein
MLVTFNKSIDTREQSELFDWLFYNLGSPPTRWRLQSLNSIEFKNREDGIFFKLVWGNRC